MLRVARPAYESMVAQAEAGAPREVCGVLAGSDGGNHTGGDRPGGGERPGKRYGDSERRAGGERPGGERPGGERPTGSERRAGRERRVAAVHRVANVAEAPRTEYRMEPEEQLSAIDVVETSGLDVVGFYHSHPAGPAGPSPTDEARATWPGHVYAIVSLAGDEPELRAWEWTGESFEELEVHVER